MSVYRSLLNRCVAAGCCRLRGAVSPPLVRFKSASVAEPGARRSDEEHLWETSGDLPFARSRVGTFFQERPVLKNPFLEDALLRGYLRRHLPEEVRRQHRVT